MSGETEEQPSGLTPDHVLRFVRALLDEHDRRYEQRFVAQEKAVDTALLSMNERLAGMNEFRSTLQDQQRTFVSRSDVDTRLQALVERLDGTAALLAGVGSKVDGMQARRQGAGNLAGGLMLGAGFLVGAAGVVVAVVR